MRARVHGDLEPQCGQLPHEGRQGQPPVFSNGDYPPGDGPSQIAFSSSSSSGGGGLTCNGILLRLSLAARCANCMMQIGILSLTQCTLFQIQVNPKSQIAMAICKSTRTAITFAFPNRTTTSCLSFLRELMLRYGVLITEGFQVRAFEFLIRIANACKEKISV